jgi:hypothetical protein
LSQNLTPMNKSEKLLKELTDAKILPMDIDKVKAQLIIRQLFIEVHQEAVQSTVIACHRNKYVEPPFND